tara:strand:- start:560 stop:1642 length:1083 start_codon:yes stop_codon:yes gene_type:complete
MDKKPFKIVELVIDEENEDVSIDAISLVTEPAIMVDFLYFNKQKKSNVCLAKLDEEQQMLVSPALIPNKQIFRVGEDGQEYYVYFSKETVRKSAHSYLKYQNNHNATIQHESKVSGVFTVESWIVEDKENDKSTKYGFDVPEGTWMVAMKIENDEVIQGIKDGVLKGLSIEGFFVDKMQKMSSEKMEQIGEMDGFPIFDTKESAIEYAKTIGCDGFHSHILDDGSEVFMPCTDHEVLDALVELIEEEEMKAILMEKHEFASYTNYPKGASANAEKGMMENEERGNKCATQVGKIRASQLVARKPISFKTVKRVYSYLKRAKTYDSGNWNDCGTISFALWGGDVMLRWSEKIIKQEENKTK